MPRPLAARVSALFSLVCAATTLWAAIGVATGAPTVGADSLKPAPTAPKADTARIDTIAKKPRVVVPDSTWRWPVDLRAKTCEAKQEYAETPGQCWRQSPRRALIETGFPGIRALEWNLNGLEPARTEAFYQAALEESPYGTGGLAPFEAYE